MIRLQWKHPTHGDITESVCYKHMMEVLFALNVLDIARASSYTAETKCGRCESMES